MPESGQYMTSCTPVIKLTCYISEWKAPPKFGQVTSECVLSLRKLMNRVTFHRLSGQ